MARELLIKRGRSHEPTTTLPPSATGLAVLLVGLSKGARLDLVDDVPIHLRVPIGEHGILDLVIVGDTAETVPREIEIVLANAAAVVQVTDTEGEF